MRARCVCECVLCVTVCVRVACVCMCASAMCVHVCCVCARALCARVWANICASASRVHDHHPCTPILPPTKRHSSASHPHLHNHARTQARAHTHTHTHTHIMERGRLDSRAGEDRGIRSLPCRAGPGEGSPFNIVSRGPDRAGPGRTDKSGHKLSRLSRSLQPGPARRRRRCRRRCSHRRRWKLWTTNQPPLPPTPFVGSHG